MSSLENNNKIRRRWSEEEDEKLKTLLAHAADNDNENHLGWTEVAEQIKTRNANQCRERWSNHLRPGIRRGEWTSEEDEAIVRLQKQHGNRWSMISSNPPLMGRTDIDIKNRWHVLHRRQVAAQMASLHTSTKRKSTTLTTTTTPIVGMKVLVTFEEEKGFHKLYDGTITKVEEHPDVDDAFKLELQYTDGSTEDAMCPDEDIYLVDCSQSTVDGLTEEEVSISAELLNIYLELSKSNSNHDGNKSKKPRMTTTTSKTDDNDEEEEQGGGDIIFTKENQNVNLTPR